eukprot:2019545-Pleurochrysis_carterae.AAC.10
MCSHERPACVCSRVLIRSSGVVRSAVSAPAAAPATALRAPLCSARPAANADVVRFAGAHQQ